VIKVLRLALLLAFLLLVQVTLIPHARAFEVVPDLGLVTTVAIAYREGPEMGAVFGFFAGFVTDLFLSTPLGVSALAFALTGYLVGVVQGGLLRTAWWVPPLLGVVGGLVGGLLFLGIGGLVGQDQLFTLHALQLVGRAALYDGIAALVIFPLVAMVDPAEDTGRLRSDSSRW
jgi:rod shape-determining protein MreD